MIRLDSSLHSPDGEQWRAPLGPSQATVICNCDGKARISGAGFKMVDWSNPLDAIAYLDSPESRTPNMRWVGYFSYDLGRWFEPAVSHRHQPDLPLFIFTQHRIETIASDLSAMSRLQGKLLGSNLRRQQYLSIVSRAIDYISAGDIFQVNLAQQLQLESDCTPMQLYSNIQRLYPAWYAGLLDYGDFSLVCNSPELFLKTWHDHEGKTHILTRPIKGTRPRQPGMDQELTDSIKDQAELNMIVDLERNDLGRICEIGSVKVTHPRIIETHPTVYHGAASIEGVLNKNCKLLDLLKATFPGGSITGAPKIRAMQIIDDLEPDPRGPYCGAIGYINPDGTVQFNIAIRTMICRGRRISIPVGGGIVADSIPELEYAETITKAQAALSSLSIRSVDW